MNENEIELAWAAGLWDGEGCAHQCFPMQRYKTKNGIVEKRYKHRASSMVQTHNPCVLERFISAVGVGKLYGPYPATATGNPFWEIKMGAKDSILMFTKLIPYLSDVKKEQAVKVFPELLK